MRVPDSVVVLAVLAATYGFLLWLASGCATMTQTCRYEAGVLVEQATRSTVIGTGETEVATTACAALSYSTQDTGISDNGKAALGTIAEGVAAGLVPP